MPTQQDEGRGGPSASQAPASQRVHEDPHRVNHTLWRAGWSAPTGEGAFSRLVRESGALRWERWQTRELRLGHTASLFLLQGLPLLHLFDGSSWFEGCGTKIYGPFFLLEGSLGEPPTMLLGVILGRVIAKPQNMTPEELLAVLYGART
jgi:hypothetical protein